jgi:MFS family permease
MVSKTLPFIAVLSHRLFLRLWLSQIFSQFAANITLFLLGLIVYKNTGSNAAVSGLFMAYGIPSVLFGLLAGTAVDYIDKRIIILYSCIIRAMLILGLLFTSHQIGVVYVLLFLNAVVTQFFVPAEATMIPKLVPAKHLVPANSLFSFAYYGSIAVGFIAAGPLLRFFGHYGSLLFLSCLYIFAWWISLQLPVSSDDTKLWKKIRTLDIGGMFLKLFNSLKGGVAYVRHSPVLFDAVLLLTGTQIIIAMLSTLGPGFADKVLGIDVTDASVFIIGPVILGILLGGFWVGNKGYVYTPARLMNMGIVGAGLVLGIISFTVYLKRYAGFDWLFTDWIIVPIELLLFFFLGVFNSFLDVPANSVLQKEAEGDMRGRVYGVLGAFVGGVGIFPVMVGGVLADVVGVGKVIFILGLSIAIYGIFRIGYNKSSS